MTYGNAQKLTITGVPASITTSGHSDPVDCGKIQNGTIQFAISGSTGTSPTLDLYVDYLDDTNNVILSQLIHPGQLTGGPNLLTTAIGPMAGGGAAGWVLSPQVRLSWVVGGTATPTFNGCSASGYGR